MRGINIFSQICLNYVGPIVLLTYVLSQTSVTGAQEKNYDEMTDEFDDAIQQVFDDTKQSEIDDALQDKSYEEILEKDIDDPLQEKSYEEIQEKDIDDPLQEKSYEEMQEKDIDDPLQEKSYEEMQEKDIDDTLQKEYDVAMQEEMNEAMQNRELSLDMEKKIFCDKYQCKTGRPVPRPFYRASSNGCGARGSKLGYDFKLCTYLNNCCNQHDICYGTCGKSRLACDASFLICTNVPKNFLFSLIPVCQRVGTALAGIVLFAGCDAFTKAQTNACLCK